MKKFLILFTFLITLTACSNVTQKLDTNQRYYDLINLLVEREKFEQVPKYFDLSYDVSHDAEGYRYFLIIDNPKVVMKDVEIIAMEKGSDASKQMAASVGIFADNEYNMVPGQANPTKGYVKGISVSGLMSQPDSKICVLIQWKSSDLMNSYREFYEIEVHVND